LTGLTLFHWAGKPLADSGWAAIVLLWD